MELMNRKLRMGMVGGGAGAFIGAVHRIAALMDNQIELVCGCFSSQPENSKASGRACFLPDERVYTTYQEMFQKEAALPADQRMDFVSIVTPNHLHFDPAVQALSHGFHVILDKPLTFSLEEALELKKKLQETGLCLALTHTIWGGSDGFMWSIRKAGFPQKRKTATTSRPVGGPTPSGRGKPAVWATSARMPIIWQNTSPD